MKLKIVFIVAIIAIFGAMVPTWNFFKTENELFDKRQKIKTEVLLDSLDYVHSSEESTMFFNGLSQSKEYADELALVRAPTELSRLQIELRILNKRKKEMAEYLEISERHLTLLSKNLDSKRAAFKATKTTSPAFLTARKLYPFHGIYGEVFDQVKAQALSKITTPSTAKFAPFTDDETLVSEGMKDRYAVVSWVDAQNSYGATVRQKFISILEHTKTGTWRVLGFSFI